MGKAKGWMMSEEVAVSAVNLRGVTRFTKSADDDPVLIWTVDEDTQIQAFLKQDFWIHFALATKKPGMWFSEIRYGRPSGLVGTGHARFERCDRNDLLLLWREFDPAVKGFFKGVVPEELARKIIEDITSSYDVMLVLHG